MATRKLRKELGYAMKPDNRQKKQFLPRNLLANVLTPNTMQACVPGLSPDLTNFVASEAQQVFAILVYSECQEGDLTEAVQLCQRYNFTDSKLPIPELDSQCFSKRENCKHEPHLGIFHEKKWTQQAWIDFYHKQWHFLAPVFTHDQFEYVLEANMILPIERQGEGFYKGHFGSVKERFWHPDHMQGFPKLHPTHDPYHVALKVFHDTRELTAEKAWLKEKDALANIREHPNLIRRVAAVSVGSQPGQYSLISEWADGGDLKRFWHDNEKSNADADLVFDFLTQFKGMADALNCLHENGRSQTLPPSSPPSMDPSIPQLTVSNHEDAPSASTSSPAPQIVVPVNTDNWRHGDIKPENIVIVKKSGSRLGVLKIADLGLAKKHPVATNLRTKVSTTELGTQMYEPPEAVVGKAPRSRRYDIWSFGCIILEMTVWLLYGLDGLQEIWKTPIKDRYRQTLYYTIHDIHGNRTAKVNASIRRVIDNILQQDPECSNNRQSAIRDLLLLVKEKLLVVDVNQRLDAEKLSQELENLINKAGHTTSSASNSYLWTGTDRASATRHFIANVQYIHNLVPEAVPESPALTVPGAVLTTRSTSLFQKHNQQTYAHDLPDPREWTFEVDNGFAARAAGKVMSSLDFLQHMQYSPLCQSCLKMIQDLPPVRSIEHEVLTKASSKCELCYVLLRMFENTSNQPKSLTQQPRILRKNGSRYELEFEREKRLDSQPGRALSIGQMPGAIYPRDDIQISLSRLLDPCTEAHAELLQQWLLDCDENHVFCRHSSDQDHLRLPTRLIDVEGCSDSRIQLVESKSLQHQDSKALKFAALSYPWGQSPQHVHYCTWPNNYNQHIKEITWDVLPLLFQQAIILARQLKLRYIWIDGLCVIQDLWVDGKLKEKGDFDVEAERMEEVFSAAYCVIAATRATGVSDGFLGNREQRKAFRSPDSPFFVCEDINDFQHDVIKGHLNKRGWVLQERALARRTIYIAEKQTYWECGKGIRCETFTKMQNKQAAFLGDPNFPRNAEVDTKGARIRHIELLFQEYSRLQFAHDYDRPIGIAGLERRLCRAFRTEGGFGIFHLYLERGILWQRASDEVESLTKIVLRRGQNSVPSWSWMAYRGAIKFPDLPGHGIEWATNDYRSPWAGSNTSQAARGRSNFMLEVTAREFDRQFSADVETQSNIVWDGGPAVDGLLKCAVIGKLKAEADRNAQKHYVLILMETKIQGTFERVGSGYLGRNKIDFSKTGTRCFVR